MNIIKVKNYEELSDKASEITVNRLHQLNNPVIGLATGSTPAGLYERLIKIHNNKKLSFENITTFNLDEYVGIAKDHPSSYHYYMDRWFFRHVNLLPEQTFLPNGLADDLTEECNRYERLIQDAKNVDLQILGMGINGHIGFNEPGTPLDSRTDIIPLTESTIRVNGRFFNTIEEVPKRAITMGLGTIMDSREIILLVSGSHKAKALESMVNGAVTEALPASILQRHNNVTVIADEAALGRL